MSVTTTPLQWNTRAMPPRLLDPEQARQRPHADGAARAETIHTFAARVAAASRTPAARPVRFAAAGIVATATQLAILTLLIRLGWNEVPGNAVALLVSAQVNFALNATFTWRDTWRLAEDAGRRRRIHLLGMRWLRFMAANSCTLALNEITYGIVHDAMQAVLAAMLVSTGIAVLNFLLSDRFVFTPARSLHLQPSGITGTSARRIPWPVFRRKQQRVSARSVSSAVHAGSDGPAKG